MLAERTFHTLDDLCQFALECGQTPPPPQQQQQQPDKDTLDDGPHKLALLSIALGYIESILIEKELTFGNARSSKDAITDIFPLGSEIFTLYYQFVALLEQEEGDENSSPPSSTQKVKSIKEYIPTLLQTDNIRGAIKVIADLIWSKLSNSYFKDKLHVQTVYSFLSHRKLDCFGLALTTYLYCRMLHVNVALTLSEDHSWLSFRTGEGTDNEETPLLDDTAELTWNGRNAHRRASSIYDNGKGDANAARDNTAVDTMWLYQKGGKYAVQCTNNRTVVAAIVTAMHDECNLHGSAFSEPVLNIKGQLLQRLHKAGYLSEYPMGLYHLATCFSGLSYLREQNNDSNNSNKDDSEDSASCTSLIDEGKNEMNDLHNSSSTDDVSSTMCVALYNAAIDLSKEKYGNHHVYPHTALGNYYANYVEDFSSAITCYADACEVVSRYVYTKTDAQVWKGITSAIQDLTVLAKKSSSIEHVLGVDCCLEVVRLISFLAAFAVATPIPVVGEEVKSLLGTMLCAFPSKSRSLAAASILNDVVVDNSIIGTQADTKIVSAQVNARRIIGEWLKDPNGKRPRLLLLLTRAFCPPVITGAERVAAVASSKRRRRSTTTDTSSVSFKAQPRSSPSSASPRKKRRTKQHRTTTAAKRENENEERDNDNQNAQEDEEQPTLYCLCRTPYDDSREYVGCDGCDGWYHYECVKLSRRKAHALEKYLCPNCQ